MKRIELKGSDVASLLIFSFMGMLMGSTSVIAGFFLEKSYVIDNRIWITMSVSGLFLLMLSVWFIIIFVKQHNDESKRVSRVLNIYDVFKEISNLYGWWNSLFKDNILKRRFERELLECKSKLLEIHDNLDHILSSKYFENID